MAAHLRQSRLNRKDKEFLRTDLRIRYHEGYVLHRFQETCQNSRSNHRHDRLSASQPGGRDRHRFQMDLHLAGCQQQHNFTSQRL